MQILICIGLYTSAFIYAPLFYGAVFVCFIPFFVVICALTRSQLPYIVCWAVLLMTLQWWPLITIIIKQGAHPLKYCIPIVCLLLVVAGGLLTGLLSVMANKYIHCLYARVVLHVIFWWLFFEWLYRYLFFSFGYTLSYPMLPLAMQPGLLKVCVYVPMALLMFCLLLAQVAGASYYCYGNRIFLFIALISYLPFGIGLLLPMDTSQISINAQCGTPPHSAAMLDDAQEIAKCIIDARDYEYVIFPESSFCYDCLSDPTIIQLWQEYIDENQTVIIGTHAKRADQWRVTACCLTQQKVSWHDKSFLLPFAEYVPTWAPNCFKNIFLRECEAFVPAQTDMSNKCFDLLICAEFFLSKDCWRQMVKGSKPIIVLVSDVWAADSRLSDLLLLFVRFKAIEWGRVIVYCSQSRFIMLD